MSDMTIYDYNTANTIDGSTHWLLIQPGNNSVQYEKINRQTLLGVSGQPADISSTQNLTNKILDNTNTITLKDTQFTLQDNSDTTKQAQFQLSGITTATTRTYTLPDASSTLVDIASTQTLGGPKTLISPIIEGGSIDSSIITVDAISGHTTSNTGTIYGVAVTAGTIAAAGIASSAITTVKIADGAVTPNKLSSGTGANWFWSSWTPTFTNLSGGTLNFAYYVQIGKTVFWRLLYTMAGANVGGNVTFSLPVPSTGNYQIEQTIGSGNGGLSAGGFIQLIAVWTTINSAIILCYNSSSTYVTANALSSTVPVTWASGSTIQLQGYYEAA